MFSTVAILLSHFGICLSGMYFAFERTFSLFQGPRNDVLGATMRLLCGFLFLRSFFRLPRVVFPVLPKGDIIFRAKFGLQSEDEWLSAR